MVALEEIFDIQYGNSLNLNQLEQVEKGVNFVSRTAKNNGVSAVVKKLKNEVSMPIGSITVSLGGSVLEAFVQDKPYYTGYHIYCLTLKEGIELTSQQKLYYCMAIRTNKYRYSYGRQANRTLKNLLVPSVDEIPEWLDGYDVSRFDKSIEPVLKREYKFDFLYQNLVSLDRLFDVVYGVNLELNKLVQDENGINFVSRTAKNNGVSAKVKPLSSIEPIKGDVLSVAGGGSVLETFLQTEPFYSGRDLYYLKPKFNFSKAILLFYCVFIRANMYRYNYGRQANRTLKLLILPKLNDKELQEVEEMMLSLPFSSSI